MKAYNWAILGTGNIANKFARALMLLDNAHLYAVGSRDAGRAEKFAGEYGFSKHYGSYQEMLADPGVDVVYISSPHTRHLENTLMALQNGKHVICEKPMSITAAEVSRMADEAKRRGLFLMEALWPPFQPSYLKADDILKSGKMGKLLHMRGKFAFISPYDPELRTYNLALGGGSLLDIGIYPVMDILRYLGEPENIVATSVFAPTGADESTAMIFRFSDGRLAEAYSSFANMGGVSTEFYCEKGNLILTRGRDRNQHLIIETQGDVDDRIFTPPAQGYQYEAAEVMSCLDKGLTESPVVPLSFSITLARILDEVRRKAGIRYPGRDK
ncbi:MAG: Gfo/Idh/MocA family oxidoreductase [Bacteroidales bacterium]|jgi:predicted dehydrogenase|nr:Gfo/Idh/MocA family oxidoreductase [Bacteroidales bacterium]